MRVRLVARAGARARGADEHIVLHLLAVLFAVRVLPDPGAVALDDLAVDRRLPRHGVFRNSVLALSSSFLFFHPTEPRAGGSIHPLPHYDVGTNAVKGKRARVKTRVL